LGTVSVLNDVWSGAVSHIIQILDHFGVAKAFLDAGLLPRVITGTSAGGLVAALVCTRTDEELRHLLVPDIANRITACEEPFLVWFKRFWTTGARFDRYV
jgi:predicted acylesterase/phospholipase RssA